MKTTLLLIVLLACAVLAWRDGMRARERAITACRRACARGNLQFLDDTVALARWTPVRLPGRGIRLRRLYEFELTADGVHRMSGTVSMLGGSLETLYLPDAEPASTGVYETGSPGRGDVT